jgi:hypothetical protein
VNELKRAADTDNGRLLRWRHANGRSGLSSLRLLASAAHRDDDADRHSYQGRDNKEHFLLHRNLPLILSCERACFFWAATRLAP